jgi:hypothetical protein
VGIHETQGVGFAIDLQRELAGPVVMRRYRLDFVSREIAGQLLKRALLVVQGEIHGSFLPVTAFMLVAGQGQDKGGLRETSVRFKIREVLLGFLTCS